VVRGQYGRCNRTRVVRDQLVGQLGWSRDHDRTRDGCSRGLPVGGGRVLRSGDQDEFSAEVAALTDAVGVGGAVEREGLHPVLTSGPGAGSCVPPPW
jgi:hypothetical protein